MIIVETPHHITFSSSHDKPVLACTGVCQKVWWLIEFSAADKSRCMLCGGQLTPAVEHTHFTVMGQAKRQLTLDDFSNAYPMDEPEQRTVGGLLSGGARIDNLSMVKPEFVELAKAGWVK
jgi:hypothetical protein